jgi:hypothetical protein
MTQTERGSIDALAKRFEDFMGMYMEDRREDRKVFMETHDTVITLKSEMRECRKDIDKHDKDIEELKAQPGKKWSAVVGAMIGSVVGAVFGAFSNIFKQ